jgi:rubrerythrin
MTNRIIDFSTKLLDIAHQKMELLSSTIEHFDDIQHNPIFMEEIEGLYLELFNEESELLEEKEMTMPCPECGFECARIASFCMACGRNLHEQPFKEDM